MTPAGVFLTMLNKKGSIETQKSSIMFRFVALLPSNGKTDMIRVYLSHVVMRIRKLKPNVTSALSTAWAVVGGLLTRDIAPTERARPNIRSASDSILARGFCGFSDSVRATSGPAGRGAA